jgi:hypothetical protein
MAQTDSLSPLATVWAEHVKHYFLNNFSHFNRVEEEEEPKERQR